VPDDSDPLETSAEFANTPQLTIQWLMPDLPACRARPAAIVKFTKDPEVLTSSTSRGVDAGGEVRYFHRNEQLGVIP